jgi:hypothetical protein
MPRRRRRPAPRAPAAPWRCVRGAGAGRSWRAVQQVVGREVGGEVLTGQVARVVDGLAPGGEEGRQRGSQQEQAGQRVLEAGLSALLQLEDGQRRVRAVELQALARLVQAAPRQVDDRLPDLGLPPDLGTELRVDPERLCLQPSQRLLGAAASSSPAAGCWPPTGCRSRRTRSRASRSPGAFSSSSSSSRCSPACSRRSRVVAATLAQATSSAEASGWTWSSR